MPTHVRTLTPLLIASAILALAQPSAQTGPQPGRTVVQPQDNKQALLNPGMGWTLHHYDNDIKRYGVDLAPSDVVPDFPGNTTIYLRLAWSFIEPQEGKFNWAIVDTPAQRWVATGRKVALRFSCSETAQDQPYATPEWVRQAGAKGYFISPRKGIDPNGKIWEPDYDDPVFLAKLDNFLAAAAARYDGNPEIAFIDIGSFGVWGEGQTGSTSQLPYNARTVKTHIDLHRKHFKRTLLAANDDFSNQGRGIETILYSQAAGITLRDDSILVACKDKASHHAYLANLFWPTLPVVLETAHYGQSVERGCWEDGQLYLKAIEDYHASYATVHWYPREFYQKNKQLVDDINLRLGYRLQLLEASWPRTVPAAGEMQIGYTWRNAGVAPCLPGGFPAITLKDAKGGIAGVFVDEDFNANILPVGPPGQAVPVGRQLRPANQASRPPITFHLPPATILKPGDYSLFISIGTRTGTPVIALPHAGDDGQRRYLLGSITVQ